jgi:hypothetical protein
MRSMVPPGGHRSMVDGLQTGVNSLNGQTGAVTLESTDSSAEISEPSAGFINLEVPAVASWSTTAVRTFLYDPTNGNDTNPGFADVAGPYNPATQAKKTIAGLAAIFPRNLAGRSFRLLMASGAYANPDLDQLLSGMTGVGSGSVVKGTATNVTAGATAFADDTNDRTFIGATTVTGANVNGYNPTGAATTTSIPCTLNGGGAPGLPSETTSPGVLMWRLRFDNRAPTQAGLRNVCRDVSSVTGGTTIGVDQALPITPVATDVFYLEMAGVSLPSIRIGGFTSEPTSAGGISNGLQLAGIRATGTVVIGGGYIGLALFGGSSIGFRTEDILSGPSYFDPVAGVTITCGGGLRSEGVLGVQTNMQATFTTAACIGELSLLVYGQFTGRTVVVGAGILANTSALTGLGITSLRVLGPEDEAGIEMQSAWLVATDTATNVSITGCGAKPAIKPDGVGNRLEMSSAWTGSTGNTDVGLDLTGAQSSTVYLRSLPTVTGTAGDVRLSDGTIITWSSALLGVVDLNGNVLFGPGANPTQKLEQAIPVETFITPEVDFRAGHETTTAINMPLRSGKSFYFLTGRLFIDTRDATLTTGLTWNISQNGTGIAQAVGTTTGSLNATPLPQALAAAPTNVGIASMTTFPLQFQITAGVAGTGLTTCSGRYAVVGYYA